MDNPFEFNIRLRNLCHEYSVRLLFATQISQNTNLISGEQEGMGADCSWSVVDSPECELTNDESGQLVQAGQSLIELCQKISAKKEKKK
jgi:hypothetical protein